MSTTSNNIRFSFFGSSRMSVIVLDELKKQGLFPVSIITTPDKPQGRKQIMTANVTKQWAEENNIPFYHPSKFDEAFVEVLKKENVDVFIVASYGKILPDYIINLPQAKTLNIHPSLLPQYRGASPLQSVIIDDTKNTGVSIMRIDEQMDHGPIVAQEKVHVNEWPIYDDFEEDMARRGARLVAKILPNWISGRIPEQGQDHGKATYTKKFSKEDGLIDLSADPYSNFRKIQAFHTWPQAFFMHEHDSKSIRVKITEAIYQNEKLILKKVIPEGGKEITWEDFERGYKKQ